MAPPANRDKLEPKIPPARVSAQIASPVVNDGIAPDDFTGQHQAVPEGLRDRDRLRELRRSRTPSERMDRLEDKHDDVVSDVAQIRVDIEGINGKLDGLDGFMNDVRGDIKERRDRERAIESAKHQAAIDVEVARQRADVDRQAAIAVADHKAEVADALDRRKARRKLVGAILKAGGAVFVVAVAHKILQLWLPWL